MDFEWDEQKRLSNIQKHGVDFGAVAEMDWKNAHVLEDSRRDYGEPRFWAFGKIGDEVYLVAFTVRGRAYRIISMRRASNKEVARHVKGTKSNEK